MPVMTTRLSWGSKVSSCDAICSALRDGARRCWGRCRLVGTSDMTPAAQAIWRSIRPMVVQSLPTSLAAPLELHGMDLFCGSSRRRAQSSSSLGRARPFAPKEPWSRARRTPLAAQTGNWASRRACGQALSHILLLHSLCLPYLLRLPATANDAELTVQQHSQRTTASPHDRREATCR